MKFGIIHFKTKDDANKAMIDSKINLNILALYEDGKHYLNYLLSKENYDKFKSISKNNIKKS